MTNIRIIYSAHLIGEVIGEGIPGEVEMALNAWDAIPDETKNTFLLARLGVSPPQYLAQYDMVIDGLPG